MSKLTEALESIRSHPEVSRRIHVHRGGVIFNPETQKGWHKVTICAAHRRRWPRRSFDWFSQSLWPDVVMGPESIMTLRGYAFDRYEDGEEITTVKEWLQEEDIEIISGIPGAEVPDSFRLERMIELHIYASARHLRHCQEPLMPRTICLRR